MTVMFRLVLCVQANLKWSSAENLMAEWTVIIHKEEAVENLQHRCGDEHLRSVEQFPHKYIYRLIQIESTLSENDDPF